MLTQRFRLDVVPDGKPVYEAHVSQHDSKVHFEVELFAHDGDFEIPSSAQAYIECTTASGAKVTGGCTRSGNTIRFDLPDDVTEEMGRHEMEVVLKNEGQELRSLRFVVGVEGDPILL